MLIDELNSFFSIKNNKRIVLFSFLITFFVCFASYNAFICGGFVSPDGLLEGLHEYINRDWAINGCGRWALALTNMFHVNLVFSWLTILECILINWLSAHIINKILDIKNKYLYCISCVMFSIIPPIIVLYTYTNVALGFCLSILFSVMFVYFALKEKKYNFVISGFCLGFAMGFYQAQLGIAVGLIVLCLIKKLINDDKDINRYIIKTLISIIIGVLVYCIGLYVCLKIFNLEPTARVASFSISDIFINFPSRFIETYKAFFGIFIDAKFKRNIIYFLLLIIIIVELLFLGIDMIKEKRNIHLLVVILLFLLFPVFINIVGIIFPKSDITILMQVPEYLVLFVIIYLTDNLECSINKVLTCIFVLCLCILSWSFVLSANATYDSYKMSYNVYKEQFRISLEKAYELEGFEENSTKIVVIGRPNDKVLRDNIGTYKYAENLYENLLYWNDPHLDPITTYQYLLNEFGIDGGVMEYEEYINFVNKDECINMPSYPNSGYVEMVDGCAVIKFNNIYE